VSNRLTVLIGDYSNSDVGIEQVLSEWGNAGLLASVACLDVLQGSNQLKVKFATSEGVKERDFFDLLTSRIWDFVTIISLREAKTADLDEKRFERELDVLASIRNSFSGHNQVELRSGTVSLVEDEGLNPAAFDPRWDFHLVQEPLVRIDAAVASQPMREEHRAPLVSLLGVTLAGGFNWQASPLVGDLKDQSQGNYKPLRIARSFLRVVNAGRLTDEVLAGAFPASGPWSVPPDVTNARAVPPTTIVPQALIENLVTQGKFSFINYVPPKKEKAKKLGILEGLKLFLKEFIDALASIPKGYVAQIKGEAERWLQKNTFGSESSVLMKFDPNALDADFDQIAEAIQSAQLGDTIDAVGESRPWELLQQVSLGLVDGGKFPTSVPVPMAGSNRLVFTNPAAVGPSPATGPFTLTSFDKNLLEIDEKINQINPMDVPAIRGFNLILENIKKSLVPEKTAAGNAEPSRSGKSKDASDDSDSTEAIDESAKVRRKKKVVKKKKVKIRKKFWLFGKPKTSKTSIKPPADADSVGVNADAQAGEGTEADKSLAAPQAPVKKEKTDSNRQKPSHELFRSNEYVALTSFYQGANEEMLNAYAQENLAYESAKKTFGVFSGLWSLKKSCDHCGTKFDHGIIYLHEPSQELVHVGHQCAHKSMPLADFDDLLMKRLNEIEERWLAWQSEQTNSVLYRLAQQMIDGIAKAEADRRAAVEFLSTKPTLTAAQDAARNKFRKWTRRGALIFVLLLAASVLSIVFTPLPLLLFAGVLGTYGSGFVLRIVLLARELVRARFRMGLLADKYDRAYAYGRHAATELVRLSSVYEQFKDWQLIIREVVHIPFGRDIAFSSGKMGIADVRRPPAFILGQSRPDDEQKMRLYLNARSQTIHAGWLTEIMDVLKSDWAADYRNARLTGPGDNIMPEADNASSGSIVGKRPLSDADVYYPRTDFRYQLLGGRLQSKLVAKKAEQIASELGHTPIDSLLGNVEVPGLGSALSGQPVRQFLAGLSYAPLEPVAFDHSIISDLHPEFRKLMPSITLPEYGHGGAELGHIKVEAGSEFTVATWRVEISDPIGPIEVFKAYVPEVIEPVVPNQTPGTRRA
jgi:hypothetical protein